MLSAADKPNCIQTQTLGGKASESVKRVISGQSPEHYEPRSYWTRRVEPYVGSDDLGTVTSAGAPAFVNQFFHWLEGRALKEALAHLPRGGRLLDAGCGYGRWCGIYQGNRSVVGIDIVQALVKRGREVHPGTLFVVGDIRALPFASEAFDSVISVKANQHVPSGEQRATLRELARVLKKGGVFAAIELTVGRPSGHIYPNSPERWIALAQDAGFKLLERKGTHFIPVDRMIQQLRIGVGKILRRLSKPALSAQRSLPDRRGGASGGIDSRMSGYRTLAKAYYMIRRSIIILSKALEPFMEWILPRDWASHGLFIFRKEQEF